MQPGIGGIDIDADTACSFVHRKLAQVTGDKDLAVLFTQGFDRGKDDRQRTLFAPECLPANHLDRRFFQSNFGLTRHPSPQPASSYGHACDSSVNASKLRGSRSGIAMA